MASPIQQPELRSVYQPPESPRMLNGACFHCRNQGHWANNCPFKTPTKSPNPNPNPSPSSSERPNFPSILCPKCHGSCFVKISQTSANPGRPFYSCSVASPSSPNGKCRFFKWFDQVKEFESESNVHVKRDRTQDYPDCRCGAGKCRIVQQNGRQYFVCPIEKGHGACNFRRDVDERDATTPVQSDGNGENQASRLSPKRNGENQASRLSPKRTKLASPVVKDPDPISTSVDGEECDEIIDLSKIQEMALRERELGDFTKEKELQVSRFASEQAIHSRQAEFLRQISAADDTTICADPIQQFLTLTLISGWLGRLAFPPSGCLTVRQAKPFFCCVFPSYDPIYVPKLVNGVNCRPSNDLPPSSRNVQPDSSQQISGQDSQSGVLLLLSSIQNVTGIGQARDFMGQISKSLLELGLLVQNQLLTILESTEPSNHKSMEEAANKTFTALNLLSIDHASFSEHVKNFIASATSLADIEESMKSKTSSEEIMERYENEKVNFENISRTHYEAKDAITASDQRLKLLGEEASLLKEMLLQIENRLKQCERENAELKTRGGKMSEDMLESEKKFREADAAKKLHDETEAEHNAAKEALESAKAQLRKSIITL